MSMHTSTCTSWPTGPTAQAGNKQPYSCAILHVSPPGMTQVAAGWPSVQWRCPWSSSERCRMYAESRASTIDSAVQMTWQQAILMYTEAGVLCKMCMCMRTGMARAALRAARRGGSVHACMHADHAPHTGLCIHHAPRLQQGSSEWMSAWHLPVHSGLVLCMSHAFHPHGQEDILSLWPRAWVNACARQPLPTC